LLKIEEWGFYLVFLHKKKSFEIESPFLRSNGVTNRKKNNFTGKTEMLLIKEN